MNLYFRSLALGLLVGHGFIAQSQTGAVSQNDPTNSTSTQFGQEKHLLKEILLDQKALWTSPLRITRRDARWLVPLAAIAGVLIAVDQRTETAISQTPDRLAVSRNVSRFGSAYGTAGVAGGLYLVGRFTKNDRARETGLLGAEALIDSVITGQFVKVVAGRARPLEQDQNGHFFEGSDSFPSGHAVAAWSLAAVIAHQYSGNRLVQIGAYGLATLVSASRLTGQKHFPADVFVGSSLGWLIGHYVVRAHDQRIAGRRSKFLSSELFPMVTPHYESRNNVKGASLSWSF